ncbi:histidine phosphatase family protein [Clavibacter zhangzhiyongii]|uniref:histidine phosphatase family protein n=1 Tax=Clavibacter zhangzhiyongii TaxID=2768071 RepID=UPI0039E1B25E
MTAARIHLVRHGEVDNPDGILYGRLPGFGLTALGRRMAAGRRGPRRRGGPRGRPAPHLPAPARGRVDGADGVRAQPRPRAPRRPRRGLQPARGRPLRHEPLSILGKPSAWRYLVNPLRPSWGEPFVQVAARMRAELAAAAADAPDGTDAVLVSHQLPIWMAHRSVTGKPLFHDPRKRRCALSSITSFEPTADGFREVSYWAPAPELLAASTDDGAV